MKPKTIKTAYWILTVLFSLAMLMDGIGGVTRQQAGIDVMKHLGYPIYLMTITGVGKLMGTIAIIQTKYYTIKEWAFSGFAISFVGAFWSRAYVGDGIGLLIPPLVMLAIMFVLYFLWKRKEALNVG